MLIRMCYRCTINFTKCGDNVSPVEFTPCRRPTKLPQNSPTTPDKCSHKRTDTIEVISCCDEPCCNEQKLALFTDIVDDVERRFRNREINTDQLFGEILQGFQTTLEEHRSCIMDEDGDAVLPVWARGRKRNLESAWREWDRNKG